MGFDFLSLFNGKLMILNEIMVGSILRWTVIAKQYFIFYPNEIFKIVLLEGAVYPLTLEKMKKVNKTSF